MRAATEVGENVIVVGGGHNGLVRAFYLAARGMASAVEEAGGTIRRSAPVASVVTEDGHTVGVELADGQFLPSGLVVSNADPKTTLLGLVQGDGLPGEVRSRVESYDQRLSCVKWHVILSDLPDFERFFGSDYERSMAATLCISPTLNTVMDAYADVRAGRVSSEMIMELQIPTVVDDTIAPEGKHIFSSWCLWAPSQLRDGQTWEEARPEINA